MTKSRCSEQRCETNFVVRDVERSSTFDQGAGDIQLTF